MDQQRLALLKRKLEALSYDGELDTKSAPWPRRCRRTPPRAAADGRARSGRPAPVAEVPWRASGRATSGRRPRTRALSSRSPATAFGATLFPRRAFARACLIATPDPQLVDDLVEATTAVPLAEDPRDQADPGAARGLVVQDGGDEARERQGAQGASLLHMERIKKDEACDEEAPRGGGGGAPKRDDIVAELGFWPPSRPARREAATLEREYARVRRSQRRHHGHLRVQLWCPARTSRQQELGGRAHASAPRRRARARRRPAWPRRARRRRRRSRATPRRARRLVESEAEMQRMQSEVDAARRASPRARARMSARQPRLLDNATDVDALSCAS